MFTQILGEDQQHLAPHIIVRLVPPHDTFYLAIVTEEWDNGGGSYIGLSGVRNTRIGKEPVDVKSIGWSYRYLHR